MKRYNRERKKKIEGEVRTSKERIGRGQKPKKEKTDTGSRTKNNARMTHRDGCRCSI